MIKMCRPDEEDLDDLDADEPGLWGQAGLLMAMLIFFAFKAYLYFNGSRLLWPN